MAPHESSPGNPVVAPDRNARLIALFNQVIPQLQQTLLEYIPGLLSIDCNSITDRLPIESYAGPDDDSAVFLGWVTVMAIAVADHYKIGYAIAGYMRPLLKAAIDADWLCAVKGIGYSESAFDHVGELAVAAYDPEKLYPKLMKPGTAKLTTRLYKLCYRNTSFTRKKRNDQRRIIAKASNGAIANAGAEYVFTPGEIAATRRVLKQDDEIDAA